MWLLGSSINDLGNFHHVGPNQLLQSKDGGKMVGRVVKKQKPYFRVGSKVRLKMRDNEGRQNVRVREGVVVCLVRKGLRSERLHRVGDEVSDATVR